jgi:hypothetical protein
MIIFFANLKIVDHTLDETTGEITMETFYRPIDIRVQELIQ